MSITTELAQLFARDLTRVAQQIEAFPNDEALWRTAPGVTNSAGNLALHLEGNLLEFIGRQLGAVAYSRNRPLEFSAANLSRAEVAQRINKVLATIAPVFATVDLETKFPENVLGPDLSTRQFLMHLLGHLNYHLGQIDYLRRITTGDGAIKLAGL
ncbi:MAG: DinB family protein [Acidobacteria bacterium]|nr:DinB family protein [Acidobacteriota bacterium]